MGGDLVRKCAEHWAQKIVERSQEQRMDLSIAACYFHCKLTDYCLSERYQF